MKIVYFGSDVFLEVFRFLRQEHQIAALYTYHNDEDFLQERNIVKEATEAGIPVHYEKPTEEDLLAWMDAGTDLFLSAEYAYKLPIPKSEKFRGINLHSSFLPEGRSYYPIECTLQAGRTEGGVTVHKLFADLDSGDVLAQAKFPISKGDDSVDCYLYSAREALRMMKEIFKDFSATWNAATPQTGRLPYWNRPPLEAMTLHHEMSGEEAKSVFRIFNQMTEVELCGKIYFVKSLTVGNADMVGGQEVLFLDDDSVLYRLKRGHLRLSVKEKK